MMRLSKRGAGAILKFEAIYLYAYRDAVNVWTIGAGHTASAGGMKPKSGDRVTMARAMEIFRADMALYERRVAAAVRRELTQWEFDALVSFDFNTGAVSRGTVDDKLNIGDEAGAMRVLLKYVNAGGKRLEGLAARRRDEVAMFAKGVYPVGKILVRDAPGKSRAIAQVDIDWPGNVKIPVTTEV